jgi:hypothetical protein
VAKVPLLIFSLLCGIYINMSVKTAKGQRQQVCPNNCTASSGVDEKCGTARAPITAAVCEQRQSRFSGFVGEGNSQQPTANSQQPTANSQQPIISTLKKSCQLSESIHFLPTPQNNTLFSHRSNPMKKIIITLALLFALTAGAFGEQITSRALQPNLKRYILLFADSVQPRANTERISHNYYRHVLGNNSNAVTPFAQIEGDPEEIDTALEWLYASYYHPAVRDIRPPEAAAILPVNNPKLVDQIIGAETLRDLQIARFLGNTETIGRYESGLQYITGRGNATRAEIETFYRNNVRALVSQVVDEQLARLKNEGSRLFNPSANALRDAKNAITEFMLAPSEATYRDLLLTYRRNAGDGALVLGFAMGQINREISGALADNIILTGAER